MQGKSIKARGIKKAFVTAAGELEVLRGIDLEIPSGSMAAIVGASGVGKSTLLHILGTLDRSTEGTVSIGDTVISSLSDRELTAFRNRNIGYVFQFHHLLPEFTALENVMLPVLIGGVTDRREAEERASKLLDEVSLSHRVNHRPGQLSGGEQQRVAVARALILEPAVVLADEPTGNLDTKTGEELFELLQGINASRGTTFVIVTHNQSLSARCHRVIEMQDGAIKP